jgi:hypothetical protein
MTTFLALYGAFISTALAIGRLIGWVSASRPRLTVRMFISPLVVDADGRPKVANEYGHPVVQEGGAAREVIVVRAHNPGQRAIQVARVDLIGTESGRAEHLAHLPMPRTIEADGVQFWYTGFEEHPKNLCARITLTRGKTFESPPYSKLLGYMDPLNPLAGHSARES